MAVKVLSLSGDLLVALAVLPSESVADLKSKLPDYNRDIAIHDVQLVMDGACLEDNVTMKEILVDGNANLYLMRSLKSAREILFSTNDMAVELARRYDSFGDQCADSIQSLFVDDLGNARSKEASIEVLGALHSKLCAPEDYFGLATFKACLTPIALELLADASSQRYRHALVSCCAWLGPPAVLSLFDCLAEPRHSSSTGTSSYHYGADTWLASEFRKLPDATLEEILQSLPQGDNARSSQQERFCLIIKKAKATKRQKYRAITRRVRHKRVPRYDRAPEVPPRVFSSCQEVLGALQRGVWKLKTAGSLVEIWHSEFPTSKPSIEKATPDAVFEAINREPMLLGLVDEPLALAAVGRRPGSYHHLPEYLKKDSDILFAALHCDSELQSEFLRTASTSEIRQWQWHLGESRQRRKKLDQ